MHKTKKSVKLLALILLVGTLFSACAAPAQSSSVEASIRLQDDFYNAVNSEWLATTEIPDTMPMVQPMMQLQDQIDKQLRTDLDGMLQNRPKDIAPELNEFLNFYEMMKDTEQRDKDGFAALLPYLEKIEKISTLEDFNDNLAYFATNGYSLPFALFVMGDMGQSDVNSLYIDSPTVILPSVAYYGTEMEEPLLSTYEKILTQYLVALDYSQKDAEKIAADTILFDELLVPLMRTPQELSVMTSMYNPVALEDFSKANSVINFTALIQELSDQNVEQLSVVNTRYFDAFASIMTQENLPMIKNWMLANMALDYKDYLPTNFQEMWFEYNKIVTGVTESTPLEEKIYYNSSVLFAQPIGLYYGQTYFGEEAKADVTEMIEHFISVYKEKISNASWMSEETKTKAILKLDNLYVGVGYPEKIEPAYSKIKIVDTASGGTLLANTQEYTRLVIDDMYKKLGQPVDRKLWSLSASTVNANAVAMRNALYFPAGILQAPFYSKDQSASANYGGIGVVIAHEISHIFDTNGAMYDENGTISNWWTEEDYAAFGEKMAKVSAQYDGLPYAGGATDGALSVSENTADIGGMACALEVLKGIADKDYEEFFTTWAKCWAYKALPEIEIMTLNDVHAPNIYRVNILLTNFNEFHETFGTKPGDGMYLEESERITIW